MNIIHVRITYSKTHTRKYRENVVDRYGDSFVGNCTCYGVGCGVIAAVWQLGNDTMLLLKVGSRYYPSTSITRQLVLHWGKVDKCRSLVPNWTEEEFNETLKQYTSTIDSFYHDLIAGRVDKKSPHTGGARNRGYNHGKNQRAQS